MTRARPQLADLFDPDRPILQAPMAGVSTPALAAAVSEAGGLGAVSVGAQRPAAADASLAALAERTARPVNVNLFTHAPPQRDAAREARWIARAAPLLEQLGATPPDALLDPYRSFLEDDEMLEVLLAHRPAVVSVHFGVPRAHQIERLHAAGCLLLGTATCLDEARALVAAGIDVIVAQGIEAGGHRGVFEPAQDARLATEPLVRELVAELDCPVVAAGGIMTGADIAEALGWGAAAVQMGTAFIACPESSASSGHRRALASGPFETAVTSVISGRPARGLVSGWIEAFGAPEDLPDYPVAYALGKQLAAASVASGDGALEVRWAGAGAAASRALPAAELVAVLAAELDRARAGAS